MRLIISVIFQDGTIIDVGMIDPVIIWLADSLVVVLVVLVVVYRIALRNGQCRNGYKYTHLAGY